MKTFPMMLSISAVLVSMGAKGEPTVRRFQPETKECVRNKVEELFPDLKKLEFERTHFRVVANRKAMYEIIYGRDRGFTARAYVSFGSDYGFNRQSFIAPFSDGSGAIAGIALSTTAKVEMTDLDRPGQYSVLANDFSACFQK
jgi:hypothetical protein